MNPRAGTALPRLSICSPYFRDDPCGWLRSIGADPLAAQTEAVVVDDGTGDALLDAKVIAAIDAWPGPAKAIRLHRNQGRARARNRAIEGASGAYILFMDADMLPGDSEFLERYFKVINAQSAAVAFGGFTTRGATINHDTVLHHHLSEKSDCKPAAERAPRAAIAVASNNLLVRRDVFEKEPFDPSFGGWGWEDTEWALRVVASGFGLIHIDNPAIHVGLDTSEAMLRKYKEAAPNLRRLIDRHPDAGRMAGVKVARALRAVPGHPLLRPVAAWLARDPMRITPLTVRRLSIKFWRASWAADALGHNQPVQSP